jgi:3-hydroxyisobutyrate dehydrogenase
MAGHLLKAGHRLWVHNRTRAKADALVAAGATICQSAREVASRADVTITIVGTPEDVESVYLGAPGAAGSGMVDGARPGSMLVDMTTSDPGLAERIARTAATRSIDVLDAPVSGGDVGARNATLSIMVGATRPGFERARPLLEVMGKTVVHQGPPGSGQYAKLCNQVAIAATMLSVCESMALARAAKLDPFRVLESITTGAAGSWSLSQLMPRALRGDFEPGFSVQHFTKDLRIALACAEQLGLDLPGLKLAKQMYDRLREEGRGANGTQVLFTRYEASPRTTAR